MTTVQKGIVCSILLLGLPLVAGCLLQNQSRAIAQVEPPTSENTLSLRDRIQDRLQEKVQAPGSVNSLMLAKKPAEPSTRIAQKYPSTSIANRNQLVSVLADQVVTRVNQSSCRDFQSSINRFQDQPKNNVAMRARLMDAMKANPELRRSFIDAIAGPLANKMFDCGLI